MYVCECIRVWFHLKPVERRRRRRRKRKKKKKKKTKLHNEFMVQQLPERLYILTTDGCSSTSLDLVRVVCCGVCVRACGRACAYEWFLSSSNR